jgi:hypothetical protein
VVFGLIKSYILVQKWQKVRKIAASILSFTLETKGGVFCFRKFVSNHITLGSIRPDSKFSTALKISNLIYKLRSRVMSLPTVPCFQTVTTHTRVPVWSVCVHTFHENLSSSAGLWSRYTKAPTPTPRFLKLRLLLLHKSSICIIW